MSGLLQRERDGIDFALVDVYRAVWETDIKPFPEAMRAAYMQGRVDQEQKNSDIAWAAGLFEGEGSMYPYRDSKTGRLYPRLDLASTDEDVVRRFSRIVDGRAVYGPIQRGEKKPFWRWQATGGPAKKALALFAPYLGERRTARMHEVLALCATAQAPSTERSNA